MEDSMLDKIVGAFTFRKGVYAEVEKNASFTSSAWLIVVVVAFLSQLGGSANRGFGGMFVGAILGAVFAVGGFALAAFVISLIGKSMFKASVSFEEVVRTLGLAYVWNILGFAGILGAISPALVCLVSPLLIIGWVMGLIAWFIAAKEALDLDWGKTIITVIIGWVVMLIVTGIASGIVGALGFTVHQAAQLF